MRKSLIYNCLKITNFIPKNKVISYKQFSSFIALPLRLSSKILSSNDKLNKYKCYKVIKSDGSVGKYKGGKEEKIRRLERDGIKVINGKVGKEYFWKVNKFEVWKKWQEVLSKKVKITKGVKVKNVIAIDIHYKNDRFVSVAYGVYKGKEKLIIENGRVIEEYYPSFLFFTSHYPIYKVLRKIDNAILLINGFGLFHERAGLATQVAILYNLYTIGISKSLLKGNNLKFDGRFLYKNKKVVGKKEGKFFVSIGNINLQESIKIFNEFKHFFIKAHEIAKKEAKEL